MKDYGIRSVQRVSFSRPVCIAQTFPDDDLRATHILIMPRKQRIVVAISIPLSDNFFDHILQTLRVWLAMRVIFAVSV